MTEDELRTSLPVSLAKENIADRHFVITGAYGGIGRAICSLLARNGARLTVTGRDGLQLAELGAYLQSVSDCDSVRSIALDLADLEAVRIAARQLRAGDPIDVLINNAAVMRCPLARTPDGLELHMATNHFGHYLLSMEVLPIMRDGGRVVAVSSSSHRRSTVDLNDLNWYVRPYDPVEAYAQSKTANIWFASELTRRMGGNGVIGVSVHPGVVRTSLTRHLTSEQVREIGAEPNLPSPFRSRFEGATSVLWAATSQLVESRPGSYVVDCAIAEPVSAVDPRSGYAPWAFDGVGAAQLWELSDELTQPLVRT